MKLDNDLRRFLALELARGLTRHTVRVYELATHEILASVRCRGKDDLREVEARDVTLYLQLLAARGLAEATIRRRLSALRRVFGFLLGTGLALLDPTATIHRRYVPEAMRAVLSEDEMARLLEAVRSRKRRFETRDRAMLELLYSTGLRLGELCALEVQDLDLAAGLVTVRTSKNGSGRVVPMGREAAKWVRRYLSESRPKLAARAPSVGEASGTLFLRGSGRPIAQANVVNRFIARYAQQAGISKHVTAHCFRHSFAVHLLRHGAATSDIAAMLGHKGFRATQRYTRLVPHELRQVHERAHPRGRWPFREQQAEDPPQT